MIGENEGDGIVSALTSGNGLLFKNQCAGAVLTLFETATWRSLISDFWIPARPALFRFAAGQKAK